ncbi:MAG: hypothetical protein L6420_03265 [Elusimicrobia bacterium]|nr:hypothetical protein [Elusimicrobiota bacterium]
MQDDEKIQSLNLGSRAKHVLLRAGVDTVGKLKVLSKNTFDLLLGIKGYGVITQHEIASFCDEKMWDKPAVKKTPPVKKSKATKTFLKGVLKRELSLTERVLAEKTNSLSLMLPKTVFRLIQKKRLKTIMDVIGVSRKKFSKKISEDLSKIIERFLSAPEKYPLIKINTLTPRQFVEYIISMLPKEIDRFIIERRWGFWDGEKNTLDDLGVKLSLSRERVRQIQARAQIFLKDIYKPEFVKGWFVEMRKKQIKACLNGNCGIAKLEKVLPQDKTDNDLALFFISTVFRISPSLPSMFFPIQDGIVFAEEGLIKKFQKIKEDIKRILISKGRPIEFLAVFQDVCHYNQSVTPDFMRKCIDLSNMVGFDYAGHVCLRSWDCFDPRSIPEMAVKALMEIGEPAHFTHIVNKMNALFPKRAPFKVHSVHGRIIQQNSKFVYVKQGVYALKNWGMTRVPYIKDFLIQSITQKGGQTSIADLILLGKRKHGYKEISVRTTLYLHRDIFKICNNETCSLV